MRLANVETSQAATLAGDDPPLHALALALDGDPVLPPRREQSVAFVEEELGIASPARVAVSMKSYVVGLTDRAELTQPGCNELNLTVK